VETGESRTHHGRNDPRYAAEIDPVQLLPRLFEKLVELGDIARLISLALGDNGRRPQELERLIEELTEK